MEIGRRNVVFGWVWLLGGLILGAIMGMWSFGGPLASPFGDYTSLPRRLVRLGHVAFMALPMLNILYGYEIDKVKLTKNMKKFGSVSIILGAILMPLLLISAAFYEPIKYLTMLPAFLIIFSVSLIVYGLLRNFKK